MKTNILIFIIITSLLGIGIYSFYPVRKNIKEDKFEIFHQLVVSELQHNIPDTLTVHEANRVIIKFVNLKQDQLEQRVGDMEKEYDLLLSELNSYKLPIYDDIQNLLSLLETTKVAVHKKQTSLNLLKAKADSIPQDEISLEIRTELDNLIQSFKDYEKAVMGVSHKIEELNSYFQNSFQGDSITHHHYHQIEDYVQGIETQYNKANIYQKRLLAEVWKFEDIYESSKNQLNHSHENDQKLKQYYKSVRDLFYNQPDKGQYVENTHLSKFLKRELEELRRLVEKCNPKLHHVAQLDEAIEVKQTQIEAIQKHLTQIAQIFESNAENPKNRLQINFYSLENKIDITPLELEKEIKSSEGLVEWAWHVYPVNDGYTTLKVVVNTSLAGFDFKDQINFSDTISYPVYIQTKG